MQKLIKAMVVGANLVAAVAFLCAGNAALAVVFASTAATYGLVMR